MFSVLVWNELPTEAYGGILFKCKINDINHFFNDIPLHKPP